MEHNIVRDYRIVKPTVFNVGTNVRRTVGAETQTEQRAKAKDVRLSNAAAAGRGDCDPTGGQGDDALTCVSRAASLLAYRSLFLSSVRQATTGSRTLLHFTLVILSCKPCRHVRQERRI